MGSYQARTLRSTETLWKSVRGAKARLGLIRCLGGWEPLHGDCIDCKNGHRVEWIDALCNADPPEYGDWIRAAATSYKHAILFHPEATPAQNAFWVSLHVANGYPPCGLFRDLRRGLANGRQKGLRKIIQHIPEETILVALEVDQAGARIDGKWGILGLQTVEHGAGEIYPVYCQSFLKFDTDKDAGTKFLDAVHAGAFALIEKSKWTDRKLDLRWSIQRNDKVPFEHLAGGSLGGAWALLTANLYLKRSPTGLENLGEGRTIYEIDLRKVSISATVDGSNGNLGPVNANSIQDKWKAVTNDGGASVFIVASKQEGLSADMQPPQVPRFENVYAAFREIDRRQSEHVFDWLCKWETGAHFCLWGSAPFVWTTILLSFIGWLATPDIRYLFIPVLWVGIWVYRWPALLRTLESSHRLEIAADSKRTPEVWRHMAKTVVGRIEKGQKGKPPTWSLSLGKLACDWLVNMLELTAKAKPLGAPRRFKLKHVGWEFATSLGSVAALPELKSHAGPLSALFLAATVTVLSTPLQHHLAEMLPPYGKPAFLRGYPIELAKGGGKPEPDFVKSAGTDATDATFEARIGDVSLTRRIHLRVDDKYRADRRVRVTCQGCTFPVDTDQAPTLVRPVVDGEAVFDCSVYSPAGASITADLLTNWGRQLASATIRFQPQS